MGARFKQLIFDSGFTERDEQETPLRGYRSHVTAEFDDGSRFAVFFFDLVRLRQELEEESKAGRPFIAEPGLIVLPDVTRENMEKAVSALAEEGFFGHLKPLG